MTSICSTAYLFKVQWILVFAIARHDIVLNNTDSRNRVKHQRRGHNKGTKMSFMYDPGWTLLGNGIITWRQTSLGLTDDLRQSYISLHWRRLTLKKKNTTVLERKGKHCFVVSDLKYWSLQACHSTSSCKTSAKPYPFRVTISMKLLLTKTVVSRLFIQSSSFLRFTVSSCLVVRPSCLSLLYNSVWFSSNPSPTVTLYIGIAIPYIPTRQMIWIRV